MAMTKYGAPATQTSKTASGNPGTKQVQQPKKDEKKK